MTVDQKGKIIRSRNKPFEPFRAREMFFFLTSFTLRPKKFGQLGTANGASEKRYVEILF